MLNKKLKNLVDHLDNEIFDSKIDFRRKHEKLEDENCQLRSRVSNLENEIGKLVDVLEQAKIIERIEKEDPDYMVTRLVYNVGSGKDHRITVPYKVKAVK